MNNGSQYTTGIGLCLRLLCLKARGRAIITDMVTYCLGSARQKREYFNCMDGAIVLDNIEVLFCASENGRNYFAFGDVPFSDFTVAEYLNYRRALEIEKVRMSDITELGLSPNRRLGKLSSVQLRAVMFLEKTVGNTDKAVVVNLDGTRYSRKNAAMLDRLLDFIGTAYVCVTDNRFLTKAHGDFRTLFFGKTVAAKRPEFYAAKLLAKRIGAKRIAIM
ncbi:MAG: hypothetical protein J1G38_02865 [Clostridiales bacterium]|nr:hypothetical protein [Clostridiales bacterium]